MEAMNGIFDSVDYKLNRLKETGVGIGQNLFGGDDMKASIDILNKFAEAVDFLTGKLGLFGTVGAGLGIGAFIQNLDWLKCRAAKIAQIFWLVQYRKGCHGNGVTDNSVRIGFYKQNK